MNKALETEPSAPIFLRFLRKDGSSVCPPRTAHLINRGGWHTFFAPSSVCGCPIFSRFLRKGGSSLRLAPKSPLDNR